MNGYGGESPRIKDFPQFKRYPWNFPGVGLGSGSPGDDSFLIDHEDDIFVDHEGNPLTYGE